MLSGYTVSTSSFTTFQRLNSTVNIFDLEKPFRQVIRRHGSVNRDVSIKLLTTNRNLTKVVSKFIGNTEIIIFISNLRNIRYSSVNFIFPQLPEFVKIIMKITILKAHHPTYLQIHLLHLLQQVYIYI